MKRTVYFDHNATTPIDPRVKEAMLPWLGEFHGNTSSAHQYGRQASEAVEGARRDIATLLSASPLELVFTASGTEANNAVLLSVARRAEFRGDIVISGFEHPSIAGAIGFLESLGMKVKVVAPDQRGVVSAEAVMAAVGPETRLAALMLANNIVGTLQPVREVAAACRERGVEVLCDAVQAVGKIPVSVADLRVDYLTLGAHKFYGPLGAAALWIRGGVAFESFHIGGSQERRRRAGTVNVAAVVGMGAAARIAATEMEERSRAVAAVRDRFEHGLKAIPDAVIHGCDVPRLPNTSHVAFPGADGQSLMIRLDLAGFAVSTGSACSSGTVEPSKALTAMGVPSAEARSALRVSFGSENSAAEVDELLACLKTEVAALRSLAAAAKTGVVG